MSQKVTRNDCIAEIRRFLRNYYIYCQSPEPDAIREVLSSGYSVNDKLRKAGYPNFFENKYFIALKAIRNYAIHQAEIYNEAKALPIVSNKPIKADLSILCLIPSDTFNKILDSTDSKSKDALLETCVTYSKYSDIYPCIFNFGVSLFLYTEQHDLVLDSNEYRDFKNSIEHERANGYPHYVVGGVHLPNDEDVDKFIDSNLQQIDQRLQVLNELYSVENGMYTFKGDYSAIHRFKNDNKS